jgi:hypothetical protein
MPGTHNTLQPTAHGHWFLVALVLAAVGLLAMVAVITFN